MKKVSAAAALKADIALILERMATKDDIALIRDQMVTKDDLKEELKGFATKEDLNRFVTKDDMAVVIAKLDRIDRRSKHSEEHLDHVVNILVRLETEIKSGFPDHEKRITRLERRAGIGK